MSLSTRKPVRLAFPNNDQAANYPLWKIGRRRTQINPWTNPLDQLEAFRGVDNTFDTKGLEWLELLDELFRRDVFGKGKFLRLKGFMGVRHECRPTLTPENSPFCWDRWEDHLGIDLPLNALN